MIPTYNRADYLTQTLESVLKQAPSPEFMQIEVVDNCSPNTVIEALVAEIGQGRVLFHRNERNLGMVGNWNRCIERAKGHLLHILHDDDLVLPGFYDAYAEAVASYPNATLVFGPSTIVDDTGRQLGVTRAMASRLGPVEDFGSRQAVQNAILAPSVVVPRATYERIGGFSPDLSYTSDWVTFFRAGLLGTPVTVAEAYNAYRMHSGSETAGFVREGRNVEDAILAVESCLSHLSRLERSELETGKFTWVAETAAFFARKLSAEDWRASVAQAIWAFRLAPNRAHGSLLVWAGTYPVRKPLRTIRRLLSAPHCADPA